MQPRHVVARPVTAAPSHIGTDEGGGGMKRVISTTAGCALAVLAVLATHIQAQESNTSERTFMTFSSPVELPGVTLDAGTYEFRLADSPSRNVVQVFKKDGRDIVGQWTFVQASRPRTSSETVVMF